MKKKIVSLVFTFLAITNTSAQKSICSLTEKEVNKNIENCLQSPSDTNSKVVKLITDKVGISPNFSFKSCPNTINALAVINPYQNNSRAILFDFNYFGRLYEDDPASTIFIIAHEIGHHINGHTIPKNYNNVGELQKQELEADYFAGFILFKLGAKEEDIIRTINALPNPSSGSSTHPQNNARLDYALRGYMNEANNYKAELYKIREHYRTEFNQEAKFKLYDDLIRAINNYALTESEDQLDVALYIISKLDNTNPTIEQLEAYVNFKKGNYSKALNYYKNEFLKTKNDFELEHWLTILSETNYVGNDVDPIINDLEANSNDPLILNSLGIYFKQTNQPERGKNVLKKAYNLVKNKPDDILKADILFGYGRTFYDEGLENNKGASTFAKSLFKKSKEILDKYPDEPYYRLYYNPLLFHIANTQSMDGDEQGALNNYELLLQREKTRKDYLYKTNASIANIYYKQEKYSEAIQYFTAAISNSDNNDFSGMYLYQRGMTYAKNNNPELAIKDFKTSCGMKFADACDLLKKIK